MYYKYKINKQDVYKQVDILISKNQTLQILYLKHHNNELKTFHRLS